MVGKLFYKNIQLSRYLDRPSCQLAGFVTLKTGKFVFMSMGEQ